MMDLTQISLLKPAAQKSEPLSKKSPNFTTLFWHPAGPLLKYGDNMLHIEDLNPQIKTQWRMSRTELFVLGWRCIAAAMAGTR